MKKSFLFISFLSGVCVYCSAQDNSIIPVSRNKRTFIAISNTVFTSLNIGGRPGVIDFDQQETRKDTLTVIRLQAAQEAFATTNMLVVTTDTLFEFTLVWSADPPKTLYPFRFSGNKRAINGQNPPALSSAGSPNDTISQNGIRVAATSLQLIQNANRAIKRNVREDGIFLWLDDVGVDKADHHFLKLRLRNTTAVAYTIEYVKFIVSSPKSGFGSRATAAQDEYPPYLSAPSNPLVVGTEEEKELVFALSKLPLTGQQLEIVVKEASENSRGRTLTLKVPASVLTDKRKVVRL